MNTKNIIQSKLLPFFLFVAMAFGTLPAAAESRTALDNDVHAAIAYLLKTSPAANRLASSAKGALVFPNITKGGFILGIQYGNGALVRARQGGGYYISKYYNIKSASYGLQAGVQSFGYVMALMTDAAIEYVETSRGWEPSVDDDGKARTLTTETIKSDIYAFTFG